MVQASISSANIVALWVGPLLSGSNGGNDIELPLLLEYSNVDAIESVEDRRAADSVIAGFLGIDREGESGTVGTVGGSGA